MKTLSCLLLLALSSCAFAKMGVRPFVDDSNRVRINEEPLILSDLSPKEAKIASKVQGAGLDKLADNHAGFFRVEEENNATMFFWYFTPTNQSVNADEAPLLIWLQGGPGSDSEFGLFAEMGPFTVAKNQDNTYSAVPRDYSWTDKYAMLFIDNPVGAGFSFVSNDAYCNDTKTCVSSRLHSLLTQFYNVFPEKKKAPLYITGESYAGHYVPALAYYIHTHNSQLSTENDRIPLAGIAIGDGWIDPENMIPAYPELMFNTGMISLEQKEEIAKYCEETVELIRSGKNLEAFNIWDKMLNGDVWPYGNLFHNMTGSNDYDNYLNTNEPAPFSYYFYFLQQPEVRKAIHVGDMPFPNNAHHCEFHLLEDFMTTMIGELDEIAEHYKVLLYSGQVDIIVGAPLTEAFLPKMKWSGSAEFVKAQRKVWRVNPSDSEVAGYVRQANRGRFTHAIVRGAGHVAVADQPQRTRDMIERFIQNIPYQNLPNPAH